MEACGRDVFLYDLKYIDGYDRMFNNILISYLI